MSRAAGYLNVASFHLRQSRYGQAIAHYQRCVALAGRAGRWPGMAGALHGEPQPALMAVTGQAARWALATARVDMVPSAPAG